MDGEKNIAFSDPLSIQHLGKILTFIYHFLEDYASNSPRLQESASFGTALTRRRERAAIINLAEAIHRPLRSNAEAVHDQFMREGSPFYQSLEAITYSHTLDEAAKGRMITNLDLTLQRLPDDNHHKAGLKETAEAFTGALDDLPETLTLAQAWHFTMQYKELYEALYRAGPLNPHQRDRDYDNQLHAIDKDVIPFMKGFGELSDALPPFRLSLKSADASSEMIELNDISNTLLGNINASSFILALKAGGGQVSPWIPASIQEDILCSSAMTMGDFTDNWNSFNQYISSKLQCYADENGLEIDTNAVLEANSLALGSHQTVTIKERLKAALPEIVYMKTQVDDHEEEEMTFVKALADWAGVEIQEAWKTAKPESFRAHG